MARSPDIRELAFRPAQKRALGFEVFKLSELRARVERDKLVPSPEQPLRFGEAR